MSDGETGSTPDADLVERLREVLDRHPVSFALLFGSAVRDSADEYGDLDVAVEFDDVRPADDGYSDAYLRLRTDLERSLSTPVDVIDVHSMPARFARVVFDDGVLVLGSEARRSALESELAGDPPSVEEARERVAAAVERLREPTGR